MLKLVGSLVAAAIVAVTLSPKVARAWDPQADRLVADLAYQRLTPAARAKADQIIAQSGPVGEAKCTMRTLADAADLHDCLHGRSGDFMRKVAFDPIPICGDKADTRPCPNGQCASEVLDRAIATLKAASTDPAATPAGRALALATVVYLMAEIHEPLHAADNGDSQGARVRVALPGFKGGRLTLSGVWDQDFVAEAIGTEDAGLPYLHPLADQNGADWAKGDLDAWVNDSHRVAVTDVYGRLPTAPPCGKAPDGVEPLDGAYVDFAVQVIRNQLAKAAVRLATVLNGALG